MSDTAPFTGEPLALDLVNTRPSSGDLLTTAEQLRSWLALQADRLPEGDGAEVTLTDLEAVREVRDATATVLARVRSGTRPPESALATLNRAQRTAPGTLRLAWDGTAVTAVPQRTGGTPGQWIAARLAESAAALVAGPDLQRVRVCEAPDCVLLFLAANPRRRWCSATRCGNRTRVARHYHRHKDHQDGDRTPAPSTESDARP
ncbi:CGNR zinc finger domain-containing protein [Streptomyces sp. NPDC127068]|uniref:CGNR zinc finger domain-containing protein n=1 Tax=Streptomyces sp. NPDC127068 TaxID=3347127 RepID=UPI00364F0771